MKKIKYKISKNEAIGLIPEGVIIDVFLVYKSSDIDGGLAYIPRKNKYFIDDIKYIDVGCGSLFFVQKCKSGDFYIRSDIDYINLKLKDSLKFEESIKR